MFKQIDQYELYNLYNEDPTIIDFSDNKNKINISIGVQESDYIQLLNDYLPDNLNNLVIICNQKQNILKIVQSIENHFDFKNISIFNSDRIDELYNTYSFLFTNNGRFSYPSIITQLFPKNIYVGAISTVSDDFLKSTGIQMIINLSFNKLKDFKGTEFKFPIEDSEEAIIEYILEQTFDIIEKADKILIVCDKGQSRSISVLLYYYLKKYNLGLDKGLNDIRKCRSIASPNNGFLSQIKNKL